MVDTAQTDGTVETRSDYEKAPDEFVRHWLMAIEAAGKEEEKWREKAQKTIDRYRAKDQHARAFNILYSNTQTTVPALYNSEPIPDVRRRYGDQDEDGKTVSQVIERALTTQCEMYDFDGCMKAAVKDRQLQGRGVTRVRVIMGESGSKSFECEPVIWDDFRRGPSKRWADVPWIAIRYKLTREELVALNPAVGKVVTLDAVMSDVEKDKKDKTDLPDMFKRATVWEVWEKATRRAFFIAESYTDGPLKVEQDPYKLRNFFPVPEPLYAVSTTDTLVPVCEFAIWEPLADEIDSLTDRIIGLVKVMKWRGIYDGAFASAVSAMKNLGDGELAPAEDPQRMLGGADGGIDKRVWLMPVEQAVQVVQALYEAREQAKVSLYELTGIADIMRGSTQANETLGAQQIKTQWGSLRLQEGQRDVQRYARDLFRILSDLMVEVLEPPELMAMSGIQFTEQQYAMMKSDLHREFAIEVETDSTIRADRTRDQQNAGMLAQGVAAYMQAMLPAMQAGAMPPPVFIDLMMSMVQPFKMSRQVEMSMDAWRKMAEEQAKNPPPKQPTPEEQKLQVEQQKMQMQGQMEDKRLQMDMVAGQQKMAMEQQINEQKLMFEREKHSQEMQFRQVEHEQNIALQREQSAMQAQQHRETLMSAEASKQQDRAHDADQKAQDREHQGRMAEGEQRNARRIARMKPKAAGESESESEAMESQLDEATPDEGKGLTEVLAMIANAIQVSAQATVQNGQDLRQGLGELAAAEMAETELLRGPDGRPAGARKRPMARMNQ